MTVLRKDSVVCKVSIDNDCTKKRLVCYFSRNNNCTTITMMRKIEW